MNAPDSPLRRRFYFSLARLLNGQTGGSRVRSEGVAGEAHLPGIAILLVTFLFFVNLFALTVAGWQMTSALLCLPFAAFVFWPPVLYLNSLLIRLLRASGVIRSLPDSRMQSVLIVGLTSIFAWSLTRSSLSWIRIIGIVWLVAVALNLTAAVILALINGRGKSHP